MRAVHTNTYEHSSLKTIHDHEKANVFWSNNEANDLVLNWISNE